MPFLTTTGSKEFGELDEKPIEVMLRNMARLDCEESEALACSTTLQWVVVKQWGEVVDGSRSLLSGSSMFCAN